MLKSPKDAWLKSFVVKFIFAVFVVPSIVLGAFYYLDQNGFFNLDRIDIVLDETPYKPTFLKPELERVELLTERYRGQSLWKIDLKLIANDLGQQTWIENHRVSRSWPSGLTIRIRPSEVKFLFLGHRGKLVPVIRDGRFLEPIEIKSAPDIPLLDGERFAQSIELRKKAVAALESIPQEGSFSRQTISEMRYDDKDGFWVNMIKSGVQVKIGEDQIHLKSARVSKVLDYLQGKDLEAKTIDANLSKKVLVKMK